MKKLLLLIGFLIWGYSAYSQDYVLRVFGESSINFVELPTEGIYRMQLEATDSRTGYLVTADEFWNKWSNTSTPFNSIFTLTWGGGSEAGSDGILETAMTTSRYYTLQIRGRAYSDRQAVLMETDNAPQTFSSLIHTSTPVSPGQDLVVTVNLSGAKSAQERVFVRYTKDAFSTSFVVEATNSGDTWTTATATIPGSFNTAGATVTYYAYTTTVAATNDTDHDLVTLNFGNNGGDNYSYTVASSWATAAAGNWNDTASWVSGAVPAANQPVTIAHNLTLDTDASVSSLTINESVTFTASDASARTLTIVKNSAGDQETFTNNGTWANGTGGSTLVLTGAPSSGDAIHQIEGTGVAFENVVVNKTGGSSNVGASFGTGFLVTNTLRIGSGGFISTDPPASFYGANATLEFNTSSTYEVNASDRTWSTTVIPNSIRVVTGTVQLNDARSFSGLLTIDNDATLASEGNLTVQNDASIINNGTVTGNVTVQRKFNDHSRWVMLSSPVENGEIAGDNGLLQKSQIWTQGFTGASWAESTEPNVRWFNESGEGLSMRFVAPTDGNFVNGRGYIAYLYERRDRDNAGTVIDYANTTFSVAGAPNVFTSGSFSFPVTYTAAEGNGWNLVGNPFPSYLEWNSGDWTRTNIGNYFYVWNPATGAYQARTFNNDFDAGTAGSGVTDLGNNRIAPFQGFWVRATGSSPALSVATAAQTATTTTFLSKEVELPRVTLRIEDANGRESMTSLYFTDDASSGIDANDAFQLTPLTDTYVSMFTKIGDESALINNLPSQFDSYEFPLYVIAVEGGNYATAAMDMSWELSSTVPESWVVELVDQVTGETLDVLNSDAYQFTLDAPLAKERPSRELTPMVTTSQEARFLIRVRRAETTSSEIASDLPAELSLSQNFPNPFNPTTTISFSLPVNGQVRLAVYNTLGQQIAELVNGEMSAGTHTTNFDASSLSSGVYVYRIEAAGQVLSKRMTLVK